VEARAVAKGLKEKQKSDTRFGCGCIVGTIVAFVVGCFVGVVTKNFVLGTAVAIVLSIVIGVLSSKAYYKE
jgi:undecaprenyl pyrophosphate phosphatase UppP